MNGKIGVFDSGVGGLSVLREIHRLYPHIPAIYVADQKKMSPMDLKAMTKF